MRWMMSSPSSPFAPAEASASASWRTLGRPVRAAGLDVGLGLAAAFLPVLRREISVIVFCNMLRIFLRGAGGHWLPLSCLQALPQGRRQTYQRQVAACRAQQ